MARKRYKEEQIVAILNEVKLGKAVKDVCRERGVSEQTLYRWKQRYDGMEVADVKRMKALEEENVRLKRIIAEQAIDLDCLKELNSKNW